MLTLRYDGLTLTVIALLNVVLQEGEMNLRHDLHWGEYEMAATTTVDELVWVQKPWCHTFGP